MSEAPDCTQHKARPLRREAALERQQCQVAPTKLLDRPISSVMPNAGATSYQGKNGNSKIILLIVAPKYDGALGLTPMRLR
jgi:hypothetical protein